MDSEYIPSEYEVQQVSYNNYKAAWGEGVIRVGAERELSDENLILASFRQGIQALDEKSKHHEVSMREYGKLWTWMSEQTRELFRKQLEKDRREGWVVTSHHWPGEDGSLISLGLVPSEYDVAFKRRFDAGEINWDGTPAGSDFKKENKSRISKN